MNKTKEFMKYLHENINFWNNAKRSRRDAIEGVTFSILVALDGCSGGFDGDITDLVEYDGMFHDLFCEDVFLDEKEKNNGN